MKTVRFLGDGKVGIEEVPRPRIDDASVLVRVKASAICGSELHAYFGPRRDREGYCNDGHEVVGTIAEAPPDCPYAEGTAVGACIVQGCGVCDACRRGEAVACRRRSYHGFNGHSEFYRLGLDGVRLLPDGVDWPAGTILTGDGLGVPVRAARRLGETAGRHVVVLGLGPIGLSCVLLQAYRGAAVLGADLSDYRLDLAGRLGAERTVHVEREDLKEAVLDWTGGAGADVAILCVARGESVSTALGLLRHRGTFFLLAELPRADFVLNDALIRNEIAMLGTWYYTRADYDEMLALHAAGLDYRRLITHVMPAEKAQQAYETFTSGRSGKVILTW